MKELYQLVITKPSNRVITLSFKRFVSKKLHQYSRNSSETAIGIFWTLREIYFYSDSEKPLLKFLKVLNLNNFNTLRGKVNANTIQVFHRVRTPMSTRQVSKKVKKKLAYYQKKGFSLPKDYQDTLFQHYEKKRLASQKDIKFFNKTPKFPIYVHCIKVCSKSKLTFNSYGLLSTLPKELVK